MSLFLPPEDQISSVSDLTGKIKSVLEGSIGEVWIRGEISNLRRQSSGHIYFSLKDEGSQIKGVCFRRDAERLEVQLKDGMQVVGWGRLSVYPPHGTYQLIFTHIEEDGLGRLQAQFERLKAKLKAEGLFDADRKQPIPQFPKKVAFVTSPSGAALRDFISILKRRNWNGELLVIPVRVQGKEAAAEIAQGIEWVNQNNLADLIVIGRGGGSLEDLWPFNEEIVALAVAASTLPLISAVGHEIDFVLSDFAADKRAETPSAAAELISSSFVQIREKVQQLKIDLKRNIDAEFNLAQRRFELNQSRLKEHHPKQVLENAFLRLDDFQNRLTAIPKEAFQLSHKRLNELKSNLHQHHPEHQVKYFRESLRQLSKRLKNSSHESVLNRGYTLVREQDGKVISDQTKLKLSDTLRLEFRDGERSVEVKD